MTNEQEKGNTNKEKSITVFFIRFFPFFFFFAFSPFLAFYFSLLFRRHCAGTVFHLSHRILFPSRRIALHPSSLRRPREDEFVGHRILDEHTERAYWHGMAKTLALVGNRNALDGTDMMKFSPFLHFSFSLFVLHHIPILFDSVWTGFFLFTSTDAYHLMSTCTEYSLSEYLLAIVLA